MRQYPHHMRRKAVTKTTYFSPEHEQGGNDGVLVDRNGSFVCPVGDGSRQWNPHWDMRRK